MKALEKIEKKIADLTFCYQDCKKLLEQIGEKVDQLPRRGSRQDQAEDEEHSLNLPVVSLNDLQSLEDQLKDDPGFYNKLVRHSLMLLYVVTLV